MTPALRNRLKKIVGYPAAFLAAFFFFLYVTFPYQEAQRIITTEARSAGFALKIGSLGPGLFGPTAKQVKIAPVSAAADENVGIVIDSIAVRPSLFPIGVAVRARLFGGTASGHAGLLKKRPPISLRVSGVDLARAGIKEAFGPDLKGTLTADADVDLDPTDPTKAAGQVELDIKNAVISGNLPKLDAGEIEGQLKLKDGKATIDRLSANGPDIEAEADGSLTLNRNLLFSTPQLTAKFKLKQESDFAKTVKLLLFQMGANPDSQGFYKIVVDGGLLVNPKYRFQR